MLAVAFDWNRPRHPRNIELLALLPIGFLLFEVMRFFELLQDPIYWQLMDAVFIGIMFFSVLLLALALMRMKRPHAEPWRPNLPKRALMVLTLVLLSLNVMAGLLREPDDVGFYTNLGAQRLRERGDVPVRRSAADQHARRHLQSDPVFLPPGVPGDARAGSEPAGSAPRIRRVCVAADSCQPAGDRHVPHSRRRRVVHCGPPADWR